MSRAKLATPHHVVIKCPGCGSRKYLAVRDKTTERPSWIFNGDLERPTLEPSILTRFEATDVHAAEVCHSFVRDGRIEFLPDCTHALAGQTVDLPDIGNGHGDDES